MSENVPTAPALDPSPNARARVCENCGSRFQSRHSQQRFCGDACRHASGKRTRAPHVSHDELERLRRFRLEALAYGPDELLVCLWCGLLASNLSRHVSACPEMSETAKEKLREVPKPVASAIYRQEWGYNKSNPLMSEAERRQRSASHNLETGSETFQRAFKGSENSPGIAASFAAKRGEQAAKRASRGSAPRGPMRMESRVKRSGRKLGPRPDRKAAQIVLQTATRGMNLRDSAKTAGVSENKFWRIVTAADPDWGPGRKKLRAVIQRYLFDLRRWIWSLETMPTVEQILNRQTEGALRGAEPFRSFSPFVDALKAEMTRRPWRLKQLAQKKGTPAGGVSAEHVISLAARILERANEDAAGALPKAKGGRKQGSLSPKTRLRISLVAALLKLGYTGYAAAPLVYPDSPTLESAQRSLAIFRKRNGTNIQSAHSRLTLDAARALEGAAKKRSLLGL